jgi:DNA recombination protein RmuC
MGRLAGSPDFVIMFLPNESFLAMALEYEPTLMEDALTRKVLATTPGTLIDLLKVVRYGWNEQRLAENAQRIADEGVKLNSHITLFLEEFAKLGSAIKTASETYDASRRRVENQIAKSSAKLGDFGAKSKRPLKVNATRFLNVPSSQEPDVDDLYAVYSSQNGTS